MGGSQAAAKGKKAKKLEQMGKDSDNFTEASRFLGGLEVPLATTLHFRRGTNARLMPNVGCELISF